MSEKWSQQGPAGRRIDKVDVDMKWPIVLIAVVTLSSSGLQFARTQTVSEVLDKAEQALGGRAVLDDIQAIQTRSDGVLDLPTRGISEVPFKAEVVFQKPDKIRVSWEFSEQFGGDFSFGYDGHDAWGVFGAPPARCKGWHREMVLHMANEVQMFLVAPARAAYGDTFVVDAATEAESSPLTKLAYRPLASGGPWSVLFDKQTGNLVMLEHDAFQMDGSRVLGRITRSSPQRYGPLQYMSQAKFEAFRDGEVIETASETINSLEINPELPDDVFACPQWEVDPASIGVKDVAEETVVKFEHRGPYTEVGKTLEPAMDVIFASGLVPVGAVSCTYHSDPATVAPEDLRATLAHGVSKVRDKAPELPAEYELTTQPAGRVAYVYHRGDHMEEAEAHERLRAWMAQQGLQAAGPPRAIWYHDPEVTIADDLITEVQIPVDAKTPDANARAQFNPLPLDDEWSRWIVGEWTGIGESDAGSGRGNVRVELALNGQFLLVTGEAAVTNISRRQFEFLKTQLHASDEEIERFKNSPFRSLELYTLDQETGEVVGYMFDSLRCIATGRGNRQHGNQVMRWQWASGHTSTRITERVGDDKIAVIEQIAMPDGSTMEERGEMVRKK